VKERRSAGQTGREEKDKSQEEEGREQRQAEKREETVMEQQ